MKTPIEEYSTRSVWILTLAGFTLATRSKSMGRPYATRRSARAVLGYLQLKRWSCGMKVIGALSFGALVVLGQLYLTIPLMPDIEHRYGVSPSAAAWVGSGFSLAYAIGNLIFGTISDRYDRRFVMIFGVVGGAVLAGVAGLSTGFAMLVAVRAAQGFVAAAFAPVALAYAVEALSPARRALGLACISCGFLLAGIAGQAFALWGNAA